MYNDLDEYALDSLHNNLDVYILDYLYNNLDECEYIVPSGGLRRYPDHNILDT
ncbi:unnamed protein product, partial [Symbiodinium sp. CCMP2592]